MMLDQHFDGRLFRFELAERLQASLLRCAHQLLLRRFVESRTLRKMLHGSSDRRHQARIAGDLHLHAGRLSWQGVPGWRAGCRRLRGSRDSSIGRLRPARCCPGPCTTCRSARNRTASPSCRTARKPRRQAWTLPLQDTLANYMPRPPAPTSAMLTGASSCQRDWRAELTACPVSLTLPEVRASLLVLR